MSRHLSKWIFASMFGTSVLAGFTTVTAGTPRQEACAAAAAALAYAQVSDSNIIVGRDAPDLRREVPVNQASTVGSDVGGGWSKTAPARETIARFFARNPKSAASACPALTAVGDERRFKSGPQAERRAMQLNRAGVTRSWVIIRLGLPVLNHTEDEAIAAVVFDFPGTRAGNGQLLLLRRSNSGGWSVVDQLFAFVT